MYVHPQILEEHFANQLTEQNGYCGEGEGNLLQIIGRGRGRGLNQLLKNADKAKRVSRSDYITWT